ERLKAELATASSRCHYQARLANAGRSLQQQERTISRDRVTHVLVDTGESEVPLQERMPGIHDGHRRRSYAAKTLRSTGEKAGGLPGREADRSARSSPADPS